MTTPWDAALQTYLSISPLAPEGQVLRLLVESGVQAVGGDQGSLLVHDRERRDLVFAMTTASGAEEKALLGRRLPFGTGLTGLAAATRSVQVGAPTYTFEGVKVSGAPRDAEAVIAAPMLVGDDLVGVMTAVSFREGKRFLAADATLYGRMAAIAGVVVLQRQRLASMERLAGGPAGEVRAVPSDPSEASIVDSVARLCRRPTATRAEVARLLSAIDDLLGPDTGS